MYCMNACKSWFCNLFELLLLTTLGYFLKNKKKYKIKIKIGSALIKWQSSGFADHSINSKAKKSWIAGKNGTRYIPFKKEYSARNPWCKTMRLNKLCLSFSITKISHWQDSWVIFLSTVGTITYLTRREFYRYLLIG